MRSLVGQPCLPRRILRTTKDFQEFRTHHARHLFGQRLVHTLLSHAGDYKPGEGCVKGIDSIRRFISPFTLFLHRRTLFLSRLYGASDNNSETARHVASLHEGFPPWICSTSASPSFASARPGPCCCCWNVSRRASCQLAPHCLPNHARLLRRTQMPAIYLIGGL